ncbi:MAG: ABC transporter permease subunit [Phycisphaerae bacterium]|nr:ABC transporter permease subunit [Phycisphaerae bacterium]
MRPLVAEIGTWLWRLLPANPILLRVITGGSRRSRHLWIRSGYLGVLLLVVLFSQMGTASGGAQSLAEHAKNATKVFAFISYVQLALMCFFAPVLTAGAITQEKDAETFNILLTTPLSNAQIVLGSLMSRLFFVIVLLLAGLPIFCVTMLFGGVTSREIFMSFGIAGCTAVLTGSLAIAVSMMKVGTRRTIFTFFMAIAVYLMVVFVMGMWSWTFVAEGPPTTVPPRWGMSWLTPFHPFLALMAATGRVNVPAAADLGAYNPLWRWVLSRPGQAYMVGTLVASIGLVALSTLGVRRGAREGETTRLSRLWQRFARRNGNHLGDRRRKPRNVWKNPVAWREARTRASVASQGLVRYVFVFGGLLAAGVLWLCYVNGWRGVNASDARDTLSALVLIEFVTMLVLATNTAATAITREREANTMELLLTTPLTSEYIVWGKLRGLVSFTVPLIIVPTLSVAMFAVYDLFSSADPPVVHPEAILELPLLMLVYSAFACMLGLQTSLKSRRTVQAVLTSVGILVVLGFGIGMCGFLFATEAKESIGPIIAPLTMVIAVAMAVNPQITMDTTNAATLADARALMVAGTIIAACLYGVLVHTMYKNMVRNFDMTVRKQSQ